MVRVAEINAGRLLALRGKRSREVIAHELRKRGHGTDAKAIWRYETGRNQPSASLLPDYADVLGAASVDELYTAEDEAEAASMAPLAADHEATPAEDLLRALDRYFDQKQVETA